MVLGLFFLGLLCYTDIDFWRDQKGSGAAFAVGRRKMENNIEKKKKGKGLRIAGIILGVICICLFGVGLLVQHYLGMIQYDRGNDSLADASVNQAEEDGLDDERIEKELLEEDLMEEQDATEEDSPEQEILALEEQMSSQVDVETEALYDKNVVNILLIGCDSRQQSGRGRSDTMILVSINQKTEEITMTSIMRDCYVSIPGKGNNRINAAYAYGGASLLMDTLKTNFKIQVDNYVAIDFYSFVDIVDSIDGVDIEVSDAEVKVMNGYIKELNKLNGRQEDAYQLSGGGNLHLNGTQALAYARVRYVGNADFERTQRQRTILTKIFEKMQNMNLLEMNNLLTTLLPEVKTDMTEAGVLAMMLKVPAYLNYDLNSQRIPVDGSYQSLRIRGMAVLGIDFDKNVQLLEETIYKYQDSE